MMACGVAKYISLKMKTTFVTYFSEYDKDHMEVVRGSARLVRWLPSILHLIDVFACEVKNSVSYTLF